MSDIGLRAGDKLVLTASSAADKAKIEESRAILPRKFKRPAVHAFSTSSRLAFEFGEINALDGFADKHAAHTLLVRLAKDKGIVGIMQKHKLGVGKLEEM